MNKYFLFALLTLGFLWSCSDAELQTPGDEYISGNQDGSYVVDIDGVFKDFSKTTSANSSSSQSEINGNNTANGSISITLPQTLSVGNYTELDGAMISINTPNGTYTNMGPDGLLSFNLSITAVNNNSGRVSGVFSGMVMDLVSGETHSLSNGKFIKIHFQPNANADRVLEAKFNDVEFDFSTNANAQGLATSALISGENVNQIQTLEISIPNGIAEATFTEENMVKFQVNLGTTSNSSDMYSNYDPVTDTYLPVTLTITSIVLGDSNLGGRVKGTFSGTITKFINGVSGDDVIVTEGKIDVPIEVVVD